MKSNVILPLGMALLAGRRIALIANPHVRYHLVVHPDRADEAALDASCCRGFAPAGIRAEQDSVLREANAKRLAG